MATPGHGPARPRPHQVVAAHAVGGPSPAQAMARAGNGKFKPWSVHTMARPDHGEHWQWPVQAMYSQSLSPPTPYAAEYMDKAVNGRPNNVQPKP